MPKMHSNRDSGACSEVLLRWTSHDWQGRSLNMQCSCAGKIAVYTDEPGVDGELSPKPNDHMSMSPNEIESLARELLSAYETGQMVPVLPSERPGFDLGSAYQVEATLKKIREAAGSRAVGRKVGYANKAMWRILKLETLVWAHMYDDTVHYSDRNSAALSIANPRSLKIEPEIVFGLREAAIAE